ncbi:DUF2785 domain-containing protein [Brevibacillus daliensis]|uniref:DUF2785 domain-containing protein n=1 Tax=Brevibacillus daliensis TaxID=2892995 RepID=UPI001E3B4A50|nr:DUF2785 domain-containing protein [Brevibacillus daliensis]
MNIKEIAIQIVRNDYQAPEHAYDIAQEMLNRQNIGSVDPELRDDYIYSILAKWFLHGVFNPDEMRQMGRLMLDEDHLFYQIGESDTDSVFTRSFSMLILTLVLSVHRERPFLSHHEIHSMKEKVFDYLRREKDLRGYIEEKGWAHATAHAADMLDELAQCLELQSADLIAILNLIQESVQEERMVFSYEEDERLTTAAIQIMERNLLSKEQIIQWVLSFYEQLSANGGIEAYRKKINTKHFVRCMFFRLENQDTTGEYATYMEAMEQVLSNIKMRS